MNPCVNPCVNSQVNIDKYDELAGGYMFDERGNADKQVEAYTFQKKIICGGIDPDMTPPKSTGIYIFSNHRQIGKTAVADYLINSGYAVSVDGVQWKVDAAKVAEEMKPHPDGQTIFQKRPIIIVNLRADDSRIHKKELYDSIEEYTDGGIGLLPKGWGGVIPLYMFIGNNPPQIGEDEAGGHLSSSRLNCYEIEGIGEPYVDDEGEERYEDYDLVVSTCMVEKAKKKGKAKFQSADYSKKAREAGVAVDVYIFFDTFEDYEPQLKRDTDMMAGKEMAKILQGKNDCFKPFLSGKGPQFEMTKFHDWLKEKGELLTLPGLKPAKYKLNGGDALGEMTIVHKNRSGTPVYSLKLKHK